MRPARPKRVPSVVVRTIEALALCSLALPSACGGAGTGGGADAADGSVRLADGRLAGDAPESRGTDDLADSRLTPHDAHDAGTDGTAGDKDRAETDGDAGAGADPPMVGIVQPQDGAVAKVGDKVVFLGVVSDDQDAPEKIAIEWSSSIDGVLLEGMAGADGYTELKTPALSVGKHTIRLTATDTGGAAQSAAILLHVNTPPATPGVELHPENPTTLDDLTAVLSGLPTDADGDEVKLTVEWFLGGTKVEDQDGVVLSHDLTTKADVWSVVVKSFDGASWGNVSQDKVTVLNSPPALAAAEIFPASADTHTAFACAGSGWSDPDGDPQTLLYQWLVNDQVVAEQTGDVLSAQHSAKGDAVACRITPDDGEASGPPVTSTAVIVANLPPSGATAALSPAQGDKTTSFECVAQGAVDPDGDQVAYKFSWKANGFFLPDAYGAVLDPGPLKKGDAVLCRVTPSDGQDVGPAAESDPALIVNAPPVLAAVEVGPAGATVQDALTCDADAADPDGDLLQFTYAWKLNGKLLPKQTGQQLPAGTAARDDQVQCQAAASDGEASTPALWSANVLVIQNALPALQGVTLTPDTGGEDTIFTCSPFGWFDADGDLYEVRFEWILNGGQLPAAKSGTLDGQSFDKGDVLLCRTIPSNGDDEGPAVESLPAAVLNTPPVILSVAVDPPQGPAGTQFKCVPFGWYDPDGEPETYEFRWFVDGVALPAATSEEYQSGFLPSGSQITCEVTPVDADGPGTPLLSSQAVIQ